MFAARELKKGLDFCSSRTHVCHLSFPERSKYIFHTALNVALYKSAKIDKAKQVDFIKKKNANKSFLKIKIKLLKQQNVTGKL